MTKRQPPVRPDELAIFVREDGSFRVLIPKAWEAETGSGLCPEAAYLAVVAILRLSMAGEESFSRELSRWAEENLDGTDTSSLSSRMN